jgi:hypothetical protein
MHIALHYAVCEVSCVSNRSLSLGECAMCAMCAAVPPACLGSLVPVQRGCSLGARE